MREPTLRCTHVTTIQRYTLFVMLPWPIQLASLCFLVLIWTAQWLDWQSTIQDRHLDCHFRKRGA